MKYFLLMFLLINSAYAAYPVDLYDWAKPLLGHHSLVGSDGCEDIEIFERKSRLDSRDKVVILKIRDTEYPILMEAGNGDSKLQGNKFFFKISYWDFEHGRRYHSREFTKNQDRLVGVKIINKNSGGKETIVCEE